MDENYNQDLKQSQLQVQGQEGQEENDWKKRFFEVKPPLKYFVIGFFVVLVVVGVWLGVKYGYRHNEEQVMCTLEAKVCSDGSSVGRVGPNCEFTECPKIITDATEVKDIVITEVSTGNDGGRKWGGNGEPSNIIGNFMV